MSAIIALEYCWYNLYSPQEKQPLKTDLEICREVADFAIHALIDQKAETAVIRPAMSGNESGVEVENDTFTALLFARLLALLDHLASVAGIPIDPSYRAVSGKLYRGLEGNQVDGVLYPYRKASRLALAPQFFLYNLPDGISEKTIDAALAEDRTPWGLDGPQLHEKYRDWPWSALRYSIAFSFLDRPQEAAQWLKHSLKYISSLGAFPEKVRLDGCVIGYWYPSPHALFVWALCTALAHVDRNGRLKLLSGLNGDWKNLYCDKLLLPGGLVLTMRVTDGSIHALILKNDSARLQKLILEVNPLYTCKIHGEINLPPGASFRL